jgi:hypothetical protein
MASIYMGRDTPAGVTLLNTYRPRSRLQTSIPFLPTEEALYTLPSSAPSLRALRRTLPENQRWAIDTLKTGDEGTAVAHGIQQGTAVAVSDGTFREYSDTAAAAFVISPNIATIEGPSVIRGENQVPGDRFSHSSYRSELAGILGILHSTRILCHFHNITSGAITIGLDNESAIEQAKGDWPLSVTQQPGTSFTKLDIYSNFHPSHVHSGGSRGIKMISLQQPHLITGQDSTSIATIEQKIFMLH